jgi:hypothetical protein
MITDKCKCNSFSFQYGKIIKIIHSANTCIRSGSKPTSSITRVWTMATSKVMHACACASTHAHAHARTHVHTHTCPRTHAHAHVHSCISLKLCSLLLLAWIRFCLISHYHRSCNMSVKLNHILAYSGPEN